MRLILTTLLLVALPERVLALPPLDEFEAAAQSHGFDNREQRALAQQRAAEAQKAWWGLLPRLSVSADYMRNQYEGSATIPSAAGAPPRTAVFVAQDQRDLTLGVTLPLFDFTRIFSVQVASSTQREQQALTAQKQLDVAKLVAMTYFQLLASLGVVGSAERALATAEQNVAYVEARRGAGFASELDALRASAEVERNRQLVAEAEYTRVTLVNSLHTLSGLEPRDLRQPEQQDDLREEGALAGWLSALERTPSVVASDQARETAERKLKLQQGALLPTVEAQASERFTNATGFTHFPYYSVGIVVGWKLELASYGASKAERASVEQARIRSERARANLHDQIFTAWHDVRRQLVKCRAARAQADASGNAVQVAQQRFGAGNATQLELIQAQRDALAADVARYQADAELATARATLRLSAGRPLIGAAR